MFDAKLADQWRYACATVDECLLWIPRHRRVADHGTNPDSRAYALGRLQSRLEMYANAIRTVSNAQEEMDAIGMEYALDSDDWRFDERYGNGT